MGWIRFELGLSFVRHVGYKSGVPLNSVGYPLDSAVGKSYCVLAMRLIAISVLVLVESL